MRLALVLALGAGVACLHAATHVACPAPAVTQGAAPFSPPAWDETGNSMLKGQYYFRYVQYTVGDQNGDLVHAIAVYNIISFDGNGNYTISAASTWDSNVNEMGCPAGSLTVSGTYAISSSGFGYLTNPLSTNDVIWGMVSQGSLNSFIGSTTETKNGFNDLFLCAQYSSSATLSALTGNYAIDYLNYPDGYVKDALAATFQMNSTGNGSIPTFTVTAWQGASTYPVTNGSVLTENNVSYNFSNGAFTFSFPNPPLGSTEWLYISPDGNFVFGGSPNSWDIFVGVRTGTPGTGFQGLYFQAGIDEDESNLTASGYGCVDTFYGALEAVNGNIIDHRRVFGPTPTLCVPPTVTYPIDLTKSDTYSNAFVPINPTLPTVEMYTDGSTRYIIGVGGIARIGMGIAPKLGISVALKTSSQEAGGQSPYLSPTGVVNAASYAPFTAGVSPGELILLYGTDFATSANSVPIVGEPFSDTLANFSVSIGGYPAPVYFVSPTQVAVVVPYEISEPSVQIQAKNANGSSNTVWALAKPTTPGVLTQTENGLGDGKTIHQSGAPVTTADPAQPGETVSVYLTGLGAVSPPISDGAIGPGQPLSFANAVFTASIGSMPATVSYAGLAPFLVGLYQLNVVVPSGISAGDLPLSIAGPAFTTSEATIPVQ